jgi:hypothetical protein
MKVNKWTVGLAAAGLVTLAPAVLAQNSQEPTPTSVPLMTALSATTVSGYVDTSAVWNPGTGNANPAPYVFNTGAGAPGTGRQDGFNLDSVDIKISKPQEEAGWSAGYTAEINVGPDAKVMDGGAYPIRQAFVALHMPIGNGIDWEFGRWDGLLGYESNDNYKDPNFTRSWGKTFEPTDHTGLLGSYNVNSSINLQAGVADTLSTFGFINARSDLGSPVIESKKSLVSLITLTAPDSWGSFKGSALYAGFDYGEGDSGGPATTSYNPTTGTTVGTGHDRQELYIGTTINTPVKDLTFGASWDWIHHFDVASGFGAPIFDARYVDSVAVYGSYKLTDKLSFNGRAEYANGPGLGALTLANPANGGATTLGFDKVIALTGTLQYDLWANVISRLEVRWDHAADTTSPFGGDAATGGLPDKKNEVLLAANVIYKF